MTVVGAWTREEVNDAARSLRELAWGYQWPAVVLEALDDEAEQLRALRESQARLVDSYTRMAETLAGAGNMDAAADALDRAATFWEGFVRVAGTLERRAELPALERAALYVYESTADLREYLGELADGAEEFGRRAADAGRRAAQGVGAGAALVLVSAFLFLRRNR